MRGNGQVGSSGLHAQQHVEPEPEIGPEVIMQDFRALAARMIQRGVVVGHLHEINYASNSSIE